MDWPREPETTLTRRQALRRLAGIGAGAAAFGIVGVPRARAAARGGHLKVSFPLDVTSLDTHISISGGDDPFLWLIYDGLLTFSPDDRSPQPQLAESWDVSADGTTYTFKLRRGVKFHDGTDFNAEAVKLNFDRFMVPATGSPLRTTLKMMQTWTAVDPHTFRVKLAEPFAPFLAMMFGRAGTIMSPAQLRKLGKDFTTQPVGAGPFRFKGRVTQTSFDVERFPAYWEREKPHLDRLTVRIIKDSNVAFEELLTGGVDVGGVPSDRVAAVRREGKLQVLSGYHTTFGHLVFNCASGVFKDVRLRKAVSVAINRQQLVETTQFGLGRAMKTLVTENSWAFNPNVDYYRHDPAQARKLLAEAGVPGGFRFRALGFTFTPVPQRGEAIQAQLRELGIQMELRNVEIAEGIKQAQAGNYDALHFTYDDPADPHFYFNGLYNPEFARAARTYVRLPETEELARVNELIRQAARVSDQAKRRTIYWQVMDLVNEQVWNASLVQHPVNFGAQKRVSGLRLWADGKAHWRDLFIVA